MSDKPEIAEFNLNTIQPPMNVTLVSDETGLAELVSFLEEQAKVPGTPVGLDLETTPLKNHYYRRCRTVQFGNIHQQFVVDLLAFCDRDSDLLYSCQGEYGKHLETAPRLSKLMTALKPYLCDGKLTLTGVSLGFEYISFYFLFGLRTYGFFDCGLVEKCIYAGSHSLKDYKFFSMSSIAERYLAMTVNKEYQES